MDWYIDESDNISSDEWRCSICGEFFPPEFFNNVDGRKVCPGCEEEMEMRRAGFFSREFD